MWGAFWGIVFLVSLLVFALVAIVVTVVGFRDIRTMFNRLRERDSQTFSSMNE